MMPMMAVFPFDTLYRLETAKNPDHVVVLDGVGTRMSIMAHTVMNGSS